MINVSRLKISASFDAVEPRGRGSGARCGSRELAERQLAIEADEIAALPDEEVEELRLIYSGPRTARGGPAPSPSA